VGQSAILMHGKTSWTQTETPLGSNITRREFPGGKEGDEPRQSNSLVGVIFPDEGLLAANSNAYAHY
jgi:hypothetical protein